MDKIFYASVGEEWACERMSPSTLSALRLMPESGVLSCTPFEGLGGIRKKRESLAGIRIHGRGSELRKCEDE